LPQVVVQGVVDVVDIQRIKAVINGHWWVPSRLSMLMLVPLGADVQGGDVDEAIFNTDDQPMLGREGKNEWGWMGLIILNFCQSVWIVADNGG
jgi:hypothetical protein